MQMPPAATPGATPPGATPPGATSLGATSLGAMPPAPTGLHARLVSIAVQAVLTLILGYVATHALRKSMGLDGGDDERLASVRALVSRPDPAIEQLSSIGGLQGVKDELQRCVLLPLQHPSIFYGGPRSLRPPPGVLLVGPPGTGKTMLARAIAAESGVPMLSLHAAALESKWWGESPKLLAAAFHLASTELAPCLIFFDEVDGLGRARTEGDQSCVYSFKCELLRNMDAVADAPVAVLACTNCPLSLDPALRRRFPKELRVLPPDEAGRADILRKELRDEEAGGGTAVGRLAEATAGLTGADLAAFAADAAAERLHTARTLPSMLASAADGTALLRTLGPLRWKHWQSAAAKRGITLGRRPPPRVQAAVP